MSEVRYIYIGNKGIIPVKLNGKPFKGTSTVLLPSGKLLPVKTKDIYPNELILKVTVYKKTMEKTFLDIETHKYHIEKLQNDLKEIKNDFNINKIKKDNPELFI